MPSISFKDRITRYYIVSTALLILAVFLVVFYSVTASVYSDIDRDLQLEIEAITEQLSVTDTTFQIADEQEWAEREHNTLGINPVFIQLMDSKGKILNKSPNLGKNALFLKKHIQKQAFYDAELKSVAIRQVEFPVFHEDELMGYVLIAMSLQDSKIMLTNLSEILGVCYLLILILLYLISQFIVGQSIKPISSIIETTALISKDNLNIRIPLPRHKDELYTLSKTINDLLNRIENAITREKQFTSDASHELRTPLAVIKGTLEVLTCKPRSQTEYEEKIKFCITEVNRMNHLVDELLFLARLENQKMELQKESTFLNALILDVLTNYSDAVFEKKLIVKTNFTSYFYFETDSYLFSIVLHNLISNAIKYSTEKGQIDIKMHEDNAFIIVSIQDYGLGIPATDLDKIFNPFYRSNPSKHPEIKGTGLGLSIVNRLRVLLNFEIEITSEKGVLVILKLKKA
ncbi:ATP-binding protein [Flavobacterium sp.]|uniref:sensor histidine kinase n=1 Tax=Flavobacterium sp. TaxID=239 RepID=UPI0026150CBF|nr:ATP-binding protein [Flavobacterium sp.]MDD3005098.1 ATP-binding protein [Flavobacterium sp.]